MDENTRSLIKEIAEINIAHNHKPFNASSAQHRRFMAAYHEKTWQLQQKYPYLDFSEELQYFAF